MGAGINMSKSALVVEDNKLNMKLFTDLLKSRGFEVHQSPDGTDVIAMVKTLRPSVILMDVQLPGVSGLDLTKMLKLDDDLRAIPVLAVTAFAMKGDEEKILEAGCDGYISKPINIAEFLSTVESFATA